MGCNMNNELDILKKIKQVAMEKIANKYEEGRAVEKIVSVKEYEKLPITSANNSGEIPIVLEDVVVITKQKILENAKQIPAYEVYNRDADRLLETTDDGRIKLDREIMDDKIEQIVKAIEYAGYEAAGISSLDESGKIESFFEMVNGKLTAINEEQKEKLDRSKDREETLMEISSKTLDSQEKNKAREHEVVSEESKRKEEQFVEHTQDQKVIEEDEIDEKTDEINDSIFLDENNLNGLDEVRAIRTKSGETKIVHEVDGKYVEADGFEESHSRTGETFAASNDEVAIGEQVHTYGGIKGRNGKEYSMAHFDGSSGKDSELVEKRENRSGHSSQNEEFVSFKVQDRGMADYEINREGNANSENITARSRNVKSTNRDQEYSGDGSGRGGIAQIANANKNHSGDKDYTMDDFSAHKNPKFDDALEKFHDALKKNGINLDPDVEANVQKRIETFVEQSNQPFCEDIAESYALDAQMLQRNQNQDTEKEDEKAKDVEDKEDEGRNRLEEAMRRRH